MLDSRPPHFSFSQNDLIVSSIHVRSCAYTCTLWHPCTLLFALWIRTHTCTCDCTNFLPWPKNLRSIFSKRIYVSARRSLSFNSFRRADVVTTATASQEADDDTNVSLQGDDETDAAQQVDDVTSASQSCLPLDDTECPPPPRKRAVDVSDKSQNMSIVYHCRYMYPCTYR